MAYIVMAYVVMADTVMAENDRNDHTGDHNYTIMADIVMEKNDHSGHTDYTIMADIVMEKNDHCDHTGGILGMLPQHKIDLLLSNLQDSSAKVGLRGCFTVPDPRSARPSIHPPMHACMHAWMDA